MLPALQKMARKGRSLHKNLDVYKQNINEGIYKLSPINMLLFSLTDLHQLQKSASPNLDHAFCLISQPKLKYHTVPCFVNI